jgi:hypothetical protein
MRVKRCVKERVHEMQRCMHAWVQPHHWSSSSNDCAQRRASSSASGALGPLLRWSSFTRAWGA